MGPSKNLNFGLYRFSVKKICKQNENAKTGFRQKKWKSALIGASVSDRGWFESRFQKDQGRDCQFMRASVPESTNKELNSHIDQLSCSH